METTDPAASTILSSLAPSTFAPSSLGGGVTLEAIMAQFQCMDARLDTLNDELCQVNTHVGHIARRQVEMGGYTMPSTLVALADESDANDVDDDATASNDEDDGDASSPSDDEMST